ICLAFGAFTDRRLVRFVIWIALAAGFHASAIVFILLAPLVGGDSRRRVALALALALPGASLIASGENADVAVSRYVNTGVDAFGAAYRTGLLFLSGLTFFLFLRKQWDVAFPRDYKLAGLGALMMLAVFPLVAASTVIADRMGYYLIPVQAMIF